MTFDVEVAGRTYRVSVAPAEPSNADARRITIDDGEGGVETITVDARDTGAGWALRYPATGRSVDVGVTAASPGRYVVDLPHLTLPATIRARSGEAGVARPGGVLHVAAPLPGRIVRVLVAAGDLVQARQDIVVIEAMKMENALQALAAGRVRDVLVADGVSVEAGRLLVLIEPEA